MDLRIKSFFAAAFALPFLFSCTTLQQDVNIEQVSYDGFLVALELVKAEVVFQFFCQVKIFRCHR